MMETKLYVFIVILCMAGSYTRTALYLPQIMSSVTTVNAYCLALYDK